MVPVRRTAENVTMPFWAKRAGIVGLTPLRHRFPTLAILEEVPGTVEVGLGQGLGNKDGPFLLTAASQAPETRVIYSTYGIACNKACCKHE
jgi:hypothetical protein